MVGALLSSACTAGGCVLRAIFRMGTSSACLEQITDFGNIPAAAGGVMTVNTEWGMFKLHSTTERARCRTTNRPGINQPAVPGVREDYLGQCISPESRATYSSHSSMPRYTMLVEDPENHVPARLQ